MINFIPIFPLKIVVFPAENLNLHIFEPRYKQLINECFEQKKPFGIPPVINNEVKDFGTLINIKEISKTYPNGEMDIKTQGDRVFKILEQVPEIPGKLYAGAIVNYPENLETGDPERMKLLIQKMKDFHTNLKITKNFSKPDTALNSYDIAHHLGLSLPQEFEFLQLMHEVHRQTYLKVHLETILPALEEVKRLEERIKLNGDFRHLSGLSDK